LATLALNLPVVVLPPAPAVVFMVALRLLAFNLAVVAAGALAFLSVLFPVSAGLFVVSAAGSLLSL
jgi:hypothetical protein